MPKQFARLVDAERSTFQATLARVSDTSRLRQAHGHRLGRGPLIVAEQRDQLGLAADILLEPQGRDSAAAVAVAALHAAAAHPQAVVLILAADHVVPDTEAFVDAVRRAARGAQAGYTMDARIEPDRPATDYGYNPPVRADRPRRPARPGSPASSRSPTGRRRGADHGRRLWNSGTSCSAPT